MSTRKFKKNIVFLTAAVCILFLTGCKFRLAEISASVMAPQKVGISLEGQYRFKGVQNLEEGKYVDDTGFKTFTAEFTRDSARIGLERVEEPTYVAKLVNTYTYFVEKFRTSPSRFNIELDQMEVLRVTAEGKSFYEVFRLSDSEIGIVKGNNLIFLERTDFAKDGYGPNLDNKANQLENELLVDEGFEPIAGVLLGLRGARNAASKEPSYRTLWITNDGEIQEVYEIDNILFPRKEFWKLEVVRSQVNGVMKERLNIYAITGTPSNVKEEIVYNYPATYLDVEFIGNNYLSIRSTSKNSYSRGDMEITKTIAVDGYNDYLPVPIDTFYGEEGKRVFLNSLLQVTEDTEEELLGSTVLDSYYQSYILKRHNGNWMMASKYQSGEEKIEVPIALRADVNLVTYDDLSVPWTKIRERVPQALDAFNAPGNSFVLVRTSKYLMMYRILGGELSEEPLQMIEIKEDEEVIMAEWARGEFVKRWTDVAAREGRKIIFVQNIRQ